MKSGKVDIILPTKGRKKMLEKNLDITIANTKYPNYKVTIIFDGDPEGYEYFKANPPDCNHELVLNKESLDYAKAVNQGYDMTDGDYIVYWADDIRGPRGWLNKSTSILENNPDKHIVLFNASPHAAKGSAHGMVRRTYVEDKLYGRLFYPGYQHYGEDSELCEVGRRTGVLHYMPEPEFWHLHMRHHIDKEKWDETQKEIIKKHPFDTSLLKLRLARWKVMFDRDEHEDFYKPKTKVMYTCITGDRDKLLPVIMDRKEWKYVAYLDSIPNYALHRSANTNAPAWEIQQAKQVATTNRMIARTYKLGPHQLFPDTDVTIWIDGNILPPKNPDDWIKHLGGNDIAVLKHPTRDSIYHEAKIIMARGYDLVPTVKKQMKKYRDEGYPEDNGLVETRVVVRRNTDKVKEFNELWYQQVSNHSIRDQLSFNYCAWKLGLKYSLIPRDKIRIARHYKGTRSARKTKTVRGVKIENLTTRS